MAEINTMIGIDTKQTRQDCGIYLQACLSKEEHERLLEDWKAAGGIGAIPLWKFAFENIEVSYRRAEEKTESEEQGKLPKLPCKSGQKVFLLRKDIKSVIDGEITSIRIGEFASGMKIFIIDDNRYTEASFDKIGDIVFFTREEAEAALKEL